MKKILFLFTLAVLAGVISINDAFADHTQVTITPSPGSGAPGCEESSKGCYYPKTATIDVGGKVIFSNTDTAAHTFTAGTGADGPSGEFDTSLVIAGSSYEWTAATVGEFPYYCMVHPWMEGLIVVQESVSTPKPTPKPIPSGKDIVIPSGTGSPGCENSNSCYLPYKFSAGKSSTVTWYNADSAAHTVTSGTSAGGPDGAFDSSLIMGGSSFSHKFNSDGTYPYYCMVHPWMTGYVVIQRSGPIISPTPSPSPIPTPSPIPGTLSISTNDSQYGPGDLVVLKIHTSKSAHVAVSVIGPSGDNIVSRTVSTDSSGYGSLQFKLPDSSQSGTYVIDSTTTISGSKVSATAKFSVKSFVSTVSIVSLQPTDQQGNAISTFTKGKLGFVKVVLSSESNVSSLVTINLFDSDLTSLGIGSFKTTLSPGQSEMTLSFFIPNDANIGNGEIYANVFSDWPSQGGVPLTGESSNQVRIQ